MKLRFLIIICALLVFAMPAGMHAQSNINVVKQPAAAKYAVTRKTATTTAAEWVPQRLGRRAVTLYNLSDTTTIYFKEAGAAVTAANGFPLAPGQSKVVNTTAAIQVVAAGTAPVVADEEYD